MNHQKNQQANAPFALNFIEPYTTFHNGEPKNIPYVIDGLLTQGGFSALGGKSKYGKSSMARYEAVCVAKGLPFLGRETTQGEVILVNLEDPINHVDNCLKVLGYDPHTDSRIYILEKLSPSVNENFELLGEALSKKPGVRLVIIDTLPKLIRVNDLNEYMPVLKAVEQIHNLARSFPHLHIQGLAHCKKIKTDDPFDGLLGSTALRGEPDTNIAIYGERSLRILAAETRIGRNIPPTVLHAELEESAGADVVKNISLSKLLAEWQGDLEEKSDRKRKATHEERIISFLQGCTDHTATREETLKEVEGRRETKIAAIQKLEATGMLIVTGIEHSPTNPLTLHLNPTPSAAENQASSAAENQASSASENPTPSAEAEKLVQCFSGTVN